MTIPKSAQENLFKYIGKDSARFIKNSELLLEKYTKIWQLSQISFMETDTVNLLFTCVSAIYGTCVLKICIPRPEVVTEIDYLQTYVGQGYVKLWDCQKDDDILLLERISPGAQLWDEPDDKKRAIKFATTVKNVTLIPADEKSFPTYQLWLSRVRQNLRKKGQLETMIAYIDKAIDTYENLKKKYPEEYLLHGDLHQENLLLNSQNTYTIIDPKGVKGIPVMETARFLLNETPCDEEKLIEIVSIIANITEIPARDIMHCLFIDAVLSNSWTLEEHVVSKVEFENNKRSALEACEFFEKLLER